MKVVELLEAKKARDGAILKGGFILEKDTVNGAVDIWVLKRMLEDEELAEAQIIRESMMGHPYFTFKITSYQTGKKVSTKIRAGTAGRKMDAQTFEVALLQRFFDWVEETVNNPSAGIVK